MTWVLVVAATAGGSGTAFAAGDETEAWIEQRLRQALTQEQLDAFLAGADPGAIVTSDGVELTELLAELAIATAPDSAYHPLPTCLVVRTVDASLGPFSAGETRDFAIRGPATDLSAQGGAATGCGVASDATAVVFNFKLLKGNRPGEAYVWAPGSQRGRAVINFGSKDIQNTMVIVPMGAGAVDFRMRVTEEAQVVLQTVGYFSPAAGGGTDTLAGLSCMDGEVAKWNDTAGQWECAEDEAGGGATDIWVDEAGDTMTGPLKMSATHIEAISGPVDIREGGDSFLHNRGTINPAGSNTAVGKNSHPSGGGWWNTSAGYQALQNNTDGSGNTAVGFYALQNNTAGFQNVAIGNAMKDAKIDSFNIAIGDGAFRKGGGGGYYTPPQQVTSQENIAIGLSTMGNAFEAGTSYPLMRWNVAIGSYALFLAQGSDNVAIGRDALRNNTGGENIALGRRALYSNTMGGRNIAIGVRAGDQRSAEFGTNNILIGNSAGSNGPVGDDHILIGTNVQAKDASSGGTANNQIVIGNSAAESAFIHGIEPTDPTTLPDQAAVPLFVTGILGQLQSKDCAAGQVLKRQSGLPFWVCAASGIEPGASGNVTLGDGDDYIGINDVLQLTPRTTRPVACSAFRAGSLYAHDTGAGVIPCFCDGTTGFWKSLLDGTNCPV